MFHSCCILEILLAVPFCIADVTKYNNLIISIGIRCLLKL